MKHTHRLWLIVLAAFAGLLIALIAVILPERYLPFLFILGLLSILAITILNQPAWLMLSIAFLAPVACMVREMETIPLLGTTVSVSGLAWIFIAGACLWFLATHFSQVQIPKIFTPFLILIGWTFARWLSSSMPLTGLKDVLFYGLPSLFGIFAFWLFNRTEGDVMRRFTTLFQRSVFIPIAVYLVCIPMGWIKYTIFGPVGIIYPRCIAFYLLFVLILALSKRVYGSTAAERRSAGFIALLAAGTIFFTLSRIAGATAFLLLALAVGKPHRIRGIIIGLAAAVIIGLVAVLAVPILRERFFQNPNADVWSTIQSLRWAGRDLNWQVTVDHAMQNPIVGWGPGTARVLVAQAHRASYVTEYHPHNEYLQVFHDLGIIGVAILLWGYIPLLLRFWHRWKASHGGKDRDATMRNMAAFFSVIAILIPSIASSTLHYAFGTVPAFIIIAYAEWKHRQQGFLSAKVQTPGGQSE